MAYCITSDVLSLNKARVAGQGNNPTTDDIQTYINMIAAEIDAILINKGYSTPVDPSNTSAYGLLNVINARGAAAMVERASPNSPNLDRFELEWEEAKKMLVSAQQILDAPKDVARAEPRGPGVTIPPGVIPGRTLEPEYPYRHHSNVGQAALPFFARNMQF